MAKDKEKKQAAPEFVPQRVERHRVAKDKAVTCLRGMLTEGTDIKAADLAGGAEALALLVERGYVEAYK
jgi:hypothetical protein